MFDYIKINNPITIDGHYINTMCGFGANETYDADK